MLNRIARRGRGPAFLAVAALVALTACDDGDPAEPFVVEGEGDLRGTLYYDVDRDGVFDPFAGDFALTGVNVVVRERDTDLVMSQIATDAQGRFAFDALPVGTHDLFFALADDAGVVCQNPLEVSIRINETTNVAASAQESCLISIAEARELPADEPVTVRGVVTVGTGNISGSYFWIQDETGGIKIFGMPFAAEPGQFVEVQGLIEIFQSEIEISRGSVTLLAEDVPLPDPIEITGAELVSHEFQGSLVVVRDLEVVAVQTGLASYNVTVRAPDGSQFIVRVDEDASITRTFTVGEVIDVTGVVGPFGGSEQLFIRSDADVVPAST